MYFPQPLTQATPAAEDLIARLEKMRPAILPDWVWRDLFIIALKRMITRRQETLAQLSASEALYMAQSHRFELDPDGEYHQADTEYWDAMLKIARKRKLGRGALDKLRRAMDPLVLHLLYRTLRQRLEAATSHEERARALARFWKTTGGSTRYPKQLDDIVKRHRPGTAALEIVADRYGYTSPDSLRTIFKRHHFRLQSDEIPQRYGELKM